MSNVVSTGTPVEETTLPNDPDADTEARKKQLKEQQKLYQWREGVRRNVEHCYYTPLLLLTLLLLLLSKKWGEWARQHMEILVVLLSFLTLLLLLLSFFSQ